MEKIITFITITAWALGVVSTILVVLRIFAAASYTELERTFDEARGIRKTWPIIFPSALALICWSWIFTFQVL